MIFGGSFDEIGYTESNFKVKNSITNCYAIGNISSDHVYSNIIGLVGSNYWGTIINCYATGNMISYLNYSDVGGLVGENVNGTITNCYRYDGPSVVINKNGTVSYVVT